MNRLLTVTPPLPPWVHLRRPLDALPFPLERGPLRLFAGARQGLSHGLGQLALGAGHCVLVPAYHDGAEIEAYVRAGLSLKWYEARPSLAPDPAELESLLDSSVRALHLIHYLGFAQDAPAWRAWCDDRDLLLVEDVTQGWLGTAGGQPLGTFGDLAMFSFHESIGIPDGGAAVLRGVRLVADRAGAMGTSAMLARHGEWLTGRLGPVGWSWTMRNGSPRSISSRIALGDPDSPAFAMSERLIQRLALTEVADRRRQNYRRLQAALPSRAPDPFGRDPEGASPHAFPLFVADKGRAIAQLAAHGIDAIDAWSAPHPALPADRFPGAARRRAGVILLPVHQELRAADLERIVNAARGIPDLRMHERVFS